MGEWKTVDLAEVSDDISYGYTASAAEDAVGPKFLRITDIVDGTVNWATVPYCLINEKDMAKYRLVEGDIVIARTGATTGANYTIRSSDPKDVVFASYLIRYRIDRTKALPRYVGYCLRSSLWNSFVEGVSGGSAQPGANAKVLGSFAFDLPDLPEQRAIASVLSSLDAKIDLLHRQNKTLEAMAEALFRQWFVEEAEEGWEEKPLGSFGRIVCGKTPSKKVAEYHNGSIPFIRIPDMHGQVYLMRATDSITEKGKASQLNKTLPAGTVCVSCIATVGLVSITTRECQTNQQINSIIPGKEHYRYYLYLLMLSMYDELHAMASGGTATLNLNTSSFTKMLVPSPPDEVLRDFHGVVAPLFDKMLNNCEQLTTLTNLRDTLLPKLLSGEVRVEQFDKAVLQ